ncbi:hypothetical protein [Kitasatospora sp. NPDC001175]|uniref:hypothetical protein n=1 Tax=Kitasatospora sp. NPDC001175 TaxID=3157103 RepID=UPI003D073887
MLAEGCGEDLLLLGPAASVSQAAYSLRATSSGILCVMMRKPRSSVDVSGLAGRKPVQAGGAGRLAADAQRAGPGSGARRSIAGQYASSNPADSAPGSSVNRVEHHVRDL